ncbi:hypothetical protein [Oligoflexus tunisiensis]|uniref:hypothetical protein n=1 Tax=Oligoflexus tunisiensis TaxID=708132 RepID=UPI00114CB5DD|nr:hypothetical protein [Oligoflexus tunisiensis]
MKPYQVLLVVITLVACGKEKEDCISRISYKCEGIIQSSALFKRTVVLSFEYEQVSKKVGEDQCTEEHIEHQPDLMAPTRIACSGFYNDGVFKADLIVDPLDPSGSYLCVDEKIQTLASWTVGETRFRYYPLLSQEPVEAECEKSRSLEAIEAKKKIF